LAILREALKRRKDFGGVRFQHAVFAAAVKHMKKAKEKRTPKLVAVARRLFPRIDSFKRFLKIDTWSEDRKISLKDVASEPLALGRKVCGTTVNHRTLPHYTY